MNPDNIFYNHKNISYQLFNYSITLNKSTKQGYLLYSIINYSNDKIEKDIINLYIQIALNNELIQFLLDILLLIDIQNIND